MNFFLNSILEESCYNLVAFFFFGHLQLLVDSQYRTGYKVEKQCYSIIITSLKIGFKTG